MPPTHDKGAGQSPPEHAVYLCDQALLVLGPSCSGKTTLCRHLRAELAVNALDAGEEILRLTPVYRRRSLARTRSCCRSWWTA
jgi:predicted NACHT family NTPase